MSKIHDKIRKLLALSEGTTSESEAAAAAEQAMRLLTEHNLSLSDIAKEQGPGVTTKVLDMKYADPWRRSIVFDAARVYLCEALNTFVPYTKKSRKYPGRVIIATRNGFMLVGKPHNIEVAESMINYLCDTVVRLARQHSSDRKKYLAFERGCGERLANRCYDLYVRNNAQTMAAEAGAEAVSGLPALYSTELTLVKEHMDEMNTSEKSIRGSKLEGSDAMAGMLAADKVNLGDQIESSAPKAEDVRLLK